MCPFDAGESEKRPFRIEPAALCLQSVDHKGLGVFALRRFQRGEVVERARVILMPGSQWEILNRTALEHYYYKWGSEAVCIASGFGSFYNHSDTPNVRYDPKFDEQVMEYIALRDIECGEEITIKYGCPIWFEPCG